VPRSRYTASGKSGGTHPIAPQIEPDVVHEGWLATAGVRRGSQSGDCRADDPERLVHVSVIERSIEVDVPLRVAYDQWTQFEDFPKFMGGVDEVRQVSDDRTHWKLSIGGVTREFDADVMVQKPDQGVSWRSVDGPTHSGSVRFEELDQSRTRVLLSMDYQAEGFVEKVGDAIGVVERQATSDLERFKEFIESRGAATGSWRGEIGTGPGLGPNTAA
jgi:uncharacterized membrane protein